MLPSGVIKNDDNRDKLTSNKQKQEAQLSLTNRAMLVCKVVEVWQDFLSDEEVHVHMLQTVN